MKKQEKILLTIFIAITALIIVIKETYDRYKLKSKETKIEIVTR